MPAEKSLPIFKDLWARWVTQEFCGRQVSCEDQVDRFLALCEAEKTRKDKEAASRAAAKARAAWRPAHAAGVRRMSKPGPDEFVVPSAQTVLNWLDERASVRPATFVQKQFRPAVLWFFKTKLPGVPLGALEVAWKEDARRGGESEEPEPAPITPWEITPILDNKPLGRVDLHQPERLNSEPNTYIVQATLGVGVWEKRDGDDTYRIGLTKVTADLEFDVSQWTIVQGSHYGKGEDRPAGVSYLIGGITFTQPIDAETQSLKCDDLLGGHPFLRIALKEGAKGDEPLYLSLVAPSRTFRVVTLDDTGKEATREDSTKVKEALLSQLLKLKAGNANGEILVAQAKMQRKVPGEADGGGLAPDRHHPEIRDR